MKKKKPLVSFVIRTLNEERFIDKVLQYIYRQTIKDFEVIIVDSGSTDKTLEIVKKFPIKLIQIKPEEFGRSYALNLGINKAKGQYICILSADSLPFSTTWLEDGLRIFKDNKVAAVTGYISGVPIGYYFPKLTPLFLLPYQKKRRNYCIKLTFTNALIRKDLWRVYPIDERLDKLGCEDRDWAMEMLARGYNVVKDPKFNIIHFHFLTSQRLLRWRKAIKIIDKRKRPRKSFSKLKIN